MSWNVSAYVEKKNKETNKWELVTKEPVGNSLKYVVEDYNENRKVEHDELSDGLKEVYLKDENGDCYATFYSTDLEALERKSSDMVKESFTKINTIVKALGSDRMYSDDGEETDSWSEDDKEKLTFPVNKKLIEDLQFCINDVRDAGRREAFDLLVSQHINYDGEYRVIFVVS